MHLGAFCIGAHYATPEQYINTLDSQLFYLKNEKLQKS